MRGRTQPIYRHENPNEIYLDRFIILRTRWFGIYLHNLRLSDPNEFHDHPWASMSWILAGRYTERFHDHTSKERIAGHVGFRGARTLHRIENPRPEDHEAEWRLWDDGVLRKEAEPIGAWSLFFFARKKRQWGFVTPDGWWIDKYFHANFPKVMALRNAVAQTMDEQDAP